MRDGLETNIIFVLWREDMQDLGIGLDVDAVPVLSEANISIETHKTVVEHGLRERDLLSLAKTW